MAKPEQAARRKPRFRERYAVRERPAPAPPAPPLPPAVAPRRVSTRRVPNVVPKVTVETAAYTGLVVTGFVLRIWDVGSRAMHGDEAEHAWFAWHLFTGTGYQYDPVYHGPLQFIVTAFFFFLFGVSSATGRLMAVLFGTALIGAPYFLRRHTGRIAALLASALITFSPAFVYVSRLERDDIFTCFFALTLAIAIFGYVRTQRPRYVYLGAASAALSLSAMENTYITFFIFGSFIALVLASEMLYRSRAGAKLLNLWVRTGSANDTGTRALLVLGALLLLSFLLLVTTGIFLPFLLLLGVALVLLVNRQATLETAQAGELVWTERLRSISGQQWINAATLIIAILFLTYSTFGTNLRGIWDSSQPFFDVHHTCTEASYILNPCRRDIVGGLFYWLSQHKVHRGGEPWFYYSLLFGLYEQIAVVLGLGGIVYYLRRPTLFTTFLTYWAIWAFGIYSWAGEKFPWLIIHPLLPFTLLAAMFAGEILTRAFRLRRLVLIALVLLGLLELHSMWEVNYVNGADPVEMMVYVQSAPDTPTVASKILALSNQVTNGPDMNLTIDADDTWPFAWYLRDMTHVAYPAYPQLLQKPYSAAPAIIVDASHQPALAPVIGNRYTGHRYRLRWWFPEDYKALTWSSFGSDLVNPGYWRVVTQWLVERRPFGPKQAIWFYYYVKHGLASPY